MPVISNMECRETGYSASRITDNMLCAGFEEGMKDRYEKLPHICCFFGNAMFIKNVLYSNKKIEKKKDEGRF